MDFSFNYFGLILLFSVGFSFCGDPHGILLYDLEELDINELLNDPFVIEALESGESNHEEGHEPIGNGITRALKRKRKSKNQRKLNCVGLTCIGNKRIPESFDRLQPANLHPSNLSLEELEMKFFKEGWPYRWRELEEYPVGKYSVYWAHVCDYFWVKKNRADRRYRACYTKQLSFSTHEYATVNYRFNQLTSTKADILRCSCHFYVIERSKRVCPSEVFAIHKYSDNEYFIFIEEAKHIFNISKLWTELWLPIPSK